MLIGLIAGAIAAIVAALVSLPLHSPLDLVFNTLTVTLASLAVGLVTGLALDWLGLQPSQAPCFTAVRVGRAVHRRRGHSNHRQPVAGTVPVLYIVPLAVIVFVLCGGLMPFLQRLQPPGSRWAAAVMVIACLALGVGLAGQGDTKSGDLSLPERADTSSTPVAQAPTTIVPTPAPTQAHPDYCDGADSCSLRRRRKSTAPTSTAAMASPTTPMTEPPSPTPVPPTAAPTPEITPTPSPAADATPASDVQPSGAVQYVVGAGSEITFTVGRAVDSLAHAHRSGHAHGKPVRGNQHRRKTFRYSGGPPFAGQRSTVP